MDTETVENGRHRREAMFGRRETEQLCVVSYRSDDCESRVRIRR